MKKSVLVLGLMLVFGASAALAETIYLKDGKIVRGKILKEDESAVMIETGVTWQRIDKGNIELISKDDVKPVPAASDKLAPQITATESSRRKHSGFYLGLQVPYNKIDGDFDGSHMPTVDSGIGFGLILGYSFNKNFGMEINWAGSGHTSAGADIGFGEFSFNLKYSVRSVADEAAFFLFAGYGSFTLGDNSLTFGGTGYNLGLGVDIPVSEKNTIGIALIRKIITYDEIIKSDAPLILVGDLNGDTTSIRFDFTHHF